jgi:hypothetical protein
MNLYKFVDKANSKWNDFIISKGCHPTALIINSVDKYKISKYLKNSLNIGYNSKSKLLTLFGCKIFSSLDIEQGEIIFLSIENL